MRVRRPSVTWLLNVDSLRRAVQRIHETHPEPKGVVSGVPFDRIAGLADKVGADACGRNLHDLPVQLDLLTA